MSASLLLFGSLVRAPELKTSKNQKPYASVSVKIATSGEIEFWSALAFGEAARAELLACVAGEKVALQGTPTFAVMTNAQGEAKVRRTLFVDALLTARPKPRDRKPRTDKQTRAELAKGAGRGFVGTMDDGGPNDDIPF